MPILLGRPWQLFQVTALLVPELKSETKLEAPTPPAFALKSKEKPGAPMLSARLGLQAALLPRESPRFCD